MEVEKDVEKLENMLMQAGIDPADVPTASPPSEGFCHPSFACDLPATCPPGEELPVVLGADAFEPCDRFLLHYRHANQLEGEFEQAPMVKTGNGFEGCIPGDYVTPEWDLLVYFSAFDRAGQTILVSSIRGSFFPSIGVRFFSYRWPDKIESVRRG